MVASRRKRKIVFLRFKPDEPLGNKSKILSQQMSDLLTSGYFCATKRLTEKLKIEPAKEFQEKILRDQPQGILQNDVLHVCWRVVSFVLDEVFICR